jgi:hypothetical protein
MVQVGQPRRCQPSGDILTTAHPYLPATTHPQLPPPHTMMSNSSGSGDILLNTGTIPSEVIINVDVLPSRWATAPDTPLISEMTTQGVCPLMLLSLTKAHTCRAIPVVVSSRN